MKIADIQRFCMHDGPGVRTTVFFKGCPLRCAWCHNPETQSAKPQLLFYKAKCIECGGCLICENGVHTFGIRHDMDRQLCRVCGTCAEVCPTGALEVSGRNYTPRQMLAIIEKDRAFYGANGGVTLSGGEPFMQAEDALTLLKLCKAAGIHTAVETCGYFPEEMLQEAVPLVDLFLWDIKDTDAQRHRQYTGADHAQIIRNLLAADALGAKTRMRCILVNGVNTTRAHYEKIAEIYGKLKLCEGVELLPYHSFGNAKAVALGKARFAEDHWIPSKEQIAEARDCLQQYGVTVF